MVLVPRGLSSSTVAFLMYAVMDGTLGRVDARRLVEPWVTGDRSDMAAGALSGATILHGLDLVSAGESGLLRHADADAESEFIVDQAELVQRCTEWLAKFRD